MERAKVVRTYCCENRGPFGKHGSIVRDLRLTVVRHKDEFASTTSSVGTTPRGHGVRSS